MYDKCWNVLSLGAGIQSTTVLLMAAKEIIKPKPEYAIFADTQYEPRAVYRHLSWLEDVAIRAGIMVAKVSVGNIRQDTLEFRAQRTSSDGKRFSSVPFFLKKPDGTQGKLKRQCTSEYKVEPIEKWIKSVVLKLRKRERLPKSAQVVQWLGISNDEGQRAKGPGKNRVKKTISFGPDGIDRIEVKEWVPCTWKVHAFPLLNVIIDGNRRSQEASYLPRTFSRQDCIDWLKSEYPGRNFPRSACICCPFRTNDEWRYMRDNEPEDWADAILFDRQVRKYTELGRQWDTAPVRIPLDSDPYIHRQMIPLDMVNLDGEGESVGGGCGTLDDGITGGLCGR